MLGAAVKRALIFIPLVILFILCGNLLADETKKADLAGRWYPADKGTLEAILEGFIRQAPIAPVDGEIFGLIAPHAGYEYSGRTAGFGFKAVRDKGYKTVVIIGFTHRKFFNGVSVYNKGGFQTPLGIATIDVDFSKSLIEQNENISFYPDLFNDENSVEMIVPFVQSVLKDAKIVPVAFGIQDYRSCRILSEALVNVIKDRSDVLIIASTDMSHQRSYKEANIMDNFTIRTMKKFEPKRTYNMVKNGASELCGVAPVVTMMLVMKTLGINKIKVLKYENSGDVTGNKDGVVGYMSAVFYKQITEGRKAGMLDGKQKKRLLEIARTTIEEHITKGTTPEFTETDQELLEEKGAFVTLHYKGNLRGCIGNIIGRGPLYKTVKDMAIESSTGDPRFTAVTTRELKDIHIEISVLSKPERVTDVSKIVMGKHGVIVKGALGSGVYLPQVATETGWSREQFLSSLCAQKAGLSPDAWKDPKTELYIFSAEVFGEE